jgi:polysaccharide export outer membrane protein
MLSVPFAVSRYSPGAAVRHHRTRAARGALAGAALLVSAGCGGGPGPETGVVPARLPSADSAAVAGRAQLRPGDVVKINIWRESEMSRDYEVDGGGRIELPKLGRLEVTNLSADSLKHLLEARYGRFVRDPTIEVSLRRRISVLGSVKSPGIFQVDPYVTVAEALALAGGTTPDAKVDHVTLLRGDQRLSTRISTRTRLAESQVQSGDQLYVPDRGWLNRNVAIVSALLGFAGVLVVFR